MSGKASSPLAEDARPWKLVTLALYGLCGAPWLYRGSPRALWSEIAALLRRDGR